MASTAALLKATRKSLPPPPPHAGKFREMDAAADEAEHSLELHLPYIVHVMRGHPFSLVPIVVGAVSGEAGGPCCLALAAGRWEGCVWRAGGRFGGLLAHLAPPEAGVFQA